MSLDDHVCGLRAFLEKYSLFIEQRKQNCDPAGREFALIKAQAQDDKLVLSSLEGAKEINRKKNRYKDILPFDHSRVVLQKESGQDGSDYINANFIKDLSGRLSYIASQGPMPTTVNAFWKMIWENDIRLVIMACKEIEMGKPRCHRYWPENEGETCAFGEVTVTLNGMRDYTKSLKLRDLKVGRNSTERFVTQMHFTDWPDHGAPETTEPILKLVKLANKKRGKASKEPVVIHCSAGCGRTGAIIAIDCARKLIAEKKASEIDVLGLVMGLRKQRQAMVQTKEQLEYLYEVVREMVSSELDQYNIAADDNDIYMNIGRLNAPKTVRSHSADDLTDDHKQQQQQQQQQQHAVTQQELKLPKEHLVNTETPFRRTRSLYNQHKNPNDHEKATSLPKNMEVPANNLPMRSSPSMRRREELFEQIKTQHEKGQQNKTKPKIASKSPQASTNERAPVEDFLPPANPVDINQYPMKVHKTEIPKAMRPVIPPSKPNTSPDKPKSPIYPPAINKPFFTDTFDNKPKTSARPNIPPNTLLAAASKHLNSSNNAAELLDSIQPRKPSAVSKPAPPSLASKPRRQCSQDTTVLAEYSEVKKLNNVAEANRYSEYDNVKRPILKSNAEYSGCDNFVVRNPEKPSEYSVVNKSKPLRMENNNNNVQYGEVKKTANNSGGPGVVKPYAVLTLGNQHPPQLSPTPPASSSGGWTLSVETNKTNLPATTSSGPALPERTPESFIILKDREPQYSEVREDENPYSLPYSEIPTTQQHSYAHNEHTDLYSTIDTPSSHTLPPMHAPQHTPQQQEGSDLPSPKANHWYNAISLSKMKNIAKRPLKSSVSADGASIDNSLNSLAFPNRLKVKPKGPRSPPWSR